MVGISSLLIIAVLVVGIVWIGNNDSEANAEKSIEETPEEANKDKEINKKIKSEENKHETEEEKESKDKEEESEGKDKEEDKKETAEVNKETSDKVKSEAKKEEKVETQTSEAEKETKSADPSTKVIDPITKYVDVSSLNVRNGPGTNHAVITSVQEGQTVTVTELSDAWSKVNVNGKSGWLSSKYLSDKKPVVATKEEKKEESSQTTTKKPANPKNDADKLKTVSGNRQLILVTANGYSTSNATIQTFEKDGSGKWNQVLNTSGFLGKNGFGKQKEGDGKTPIGKYTIGTGFGQKGNPGTKLPWRDITSDDVWVDDSDSPLYNTWQSKSKTEGQWKSAENMTHRLYTYGFVINYNTQRTPGKGSAIFLHTGSSYTLGCVATSQSNVVSIMKWLDPSKNPVIVMTPTQNLGNY